jgi:hypothetical protein
MFAPRHRITQMTVLALLVGACAAGCASGSGATGVDVEVADAEHDAAHAKSGAQTPHPLSGVYRLEGVTVLAAHGASRPASGILALLVEGGYYSTRFTLETIYPVTESEHVPASIIGKGRGVVVGNKLAGIDSATLRLAPFEGEEGSSGELELLSTSVADILPDGRILFLKQNELGPGQDYSPSVTILEATPTGHRDHADDAGDEIDEQ